MNPYQSLLENTRLQMGKDRISTIQNANKMEVKSAKSPATGKEIFSVSGELHNGSNLAFYCGLEFNTLYDAEQAAGMEMHSAVNWGYEVKWKRTVVTKTFQDIYWWGNQVAKLICAWFELKHFSFLMSVRRTSFKDSSTYRSVFTACLLFGDWAYVDVLTSITLLSPEWFLGSLLGAIGYISVDNFANFGHRAAPFSASL